jgi:hypothetical protein
VIAFIHPCEIPAAGRDGGFRHARNFVEGRADQRTPQCSESAARASHGASADCPVPPVRVSGRYARTRAEERVWAAQMTSGMGRAEGLWAQAHSLLCFFLFILFSPFFISQFHFKFRFKIQIMCQIVLTLYCEIRSANFGDIILYILFIFSYPFFLFFSFFSQIIFSFIFLFYSYYYCF